MFPRSDLTQHVRKTGARASLEWKSVTKEDHRRGKGAELGAAPAHTQTVPRCHCSNQDATNTVWPPPPSVPPSCLSLCQLLSHSHSVLGSCVLRREGSVLWKQAPQGKAAALAVSIWMTFHLVQLNVCWLFVLSRKALLKPSNFTSACSLLLGKLFSWKYRKLVRRKAIREDSSGEGVNCKGICWI